jgi:hypothetical protein
VYKLPETLEEIVLWKLENVQVENYLHHLQMTNWPWCSEKSPRQQVLEWLARIHALGMVTSVQAYRDERHGKYYRVSVAGIRVCHTTWQEHKEIRGVTDA